MSAEPAAKTTVVIATRNRASESARTLTEVRALRPRPAIVVLDNASDDNTVAEADGHLAHMTTLADAAPIVLVDNDPWTARTTRSRRRSPPATSCAQRRIWARWPGTSRWSGQ
ncbi:glycosyltransferase family 2 protein [Nocardia sp. NPDC057455]|uniref:glycosyltransferase family 2 protein n=1 Tax=Nocardia sp. NPDC057455 TaxID=3346138 RepID=UPI00366FD547